jgi:predicted DNA-binding transcriptional regulator AlpA
VIEVTGLSKTTIYRLAQTGGFPKPVTLGNTRAVAWDVAALREWIGQRVSTATGKRK